MVHTIHNESPTAGIADLLPRLVTTMNAELPGCDNPGDLGMGVAVKKNSPVLKESLPRFHSSMGTIKRQSGMFH